MTQRTAAPALFLLSLLSASLAGAHGTLEVPISRVYNCFKENPENPTSAACKAAVQVGGPQALYDWNGVRQGSANGQHQSLIPDGKLCSAANESHKGLDLARTDWPSKMLTADANGNFECVFYATAVHATRYFQFYVTKEGYNPGQPLKWSDLEATPFCTVNNATVGSNNRYRMNCPLPKNKTGSHVIYVIWQRSDSPEAFYACSDVKFSDVTVPGSSWKELGQVQAREDLPSGTKVTFRLFSSGGTDLESYSLLTSGASTSAANWLYRLAQQVNATSSRVKVGVLQSNGSVVPVEAAQGNSVYSKDTTNSFQIDIVKPTTGGTDAGTGGGTDAGTGGGSYDYVYPAGQGSYTAGTRVLGTDGHIYQCKPFPYSGWCGQSPMHYAPGTGAAWRDAWNLVQ